jgi:flagellum-specific peptidoglycan hydrolase FlgJ
MRDLESSSEIKAYAYRADNSLEIRSHNLLAQAVLEGAHPIC